MTHCPHLSDAELWLDGEAGEQAGSIARHVAACPTCKAHVETMRRLDFAAREAGTRIKAPASLLERLNDTDAARPAVSAVQPTPATPTRRRLFAGFAAAASVAAIGAVAWRQGESGDLPTAVFGDFATHLAADARLDLAESNPQAVTDWFSPKVPFTLPHLASLSELGLRGGRLCWLLDRRIAAFNFDRGGEALSLYLTDARGLTCRHKVLPKVDEPAIILTDGGLSGAFWRDGDLAHALVGQPAPEIIAYFADQLHTYSPRAGGLERNPA